MSVPLLLSEIRSKSSMEIYTTFLLAITIKNTSGNYHTQHDRASLDTWIRPPIENFYIFEGRLAMWCFHKLALAVRTRDRVLIAGTKPMERRTAEYLQYWAMNQIADPSGIFEPIRAELEQEDCPYDTIITGHSHPRAMSL